MYMNVSVSVHCTKILSSCTVDVQCEFANSLQAYFVQLLNYLFTTGSQTFPNELQQYGVTESILQRAFLQSTEEEIDLCWTLDKPVMIGFYE